MKKIAMLLALMLCVMMATTAMAAVQFVDCTPEEGFSVPATVKGIGYKPDWVNSKYLNSISEDYRLSFYPATSYDVFNDEMGPGTTPVGPYGGAEKLYTDIKDAMLADMASRFEDGTIIKYMFFDGEGEVWATYSDQSEDWHPITVPQLNVHHFCSYQAVWAESVTATVGYEHFESPLKGLTITRSAYYLNPDLDMAPTLFNPRIEKVPYKQTANGIQMTFDHLSPIMIAWGETPVAAPLEAPDTSDLPSTGDSSSLPGLFILLGMSITAMGAMKLRRREN